MIASRRSWKHSATWGTPSRNGSPIRAGVIAAFLGSPVDASTGTTWFHPSGITSLAETDLTYTRTTLGGNGSKRSPAPRRRVGADRVVVGHTDLGGNLDILASLRGTQQLLLDLYDAPDEVERLAGRSPRYGSATTTSSTGWWLPPTAARRVGRRSGRRAGATCCRVISPT